VRRPFLTDTPLNIPSFRDLVAASARVGFLGFGGPAGQIALMHRVFVDEKKWIDEPRFLHALSYCTLLPGPEAQQLATYVGWLLHGVRGGLAAGLLFVLPGAVLVTALAWLYAAHGDAPWLAAAFWGVKAAVMALVAEALQRVGKRALKGRGDLVIAILAFVALVVFSAPFPLVILVAAGLGLAMSRGKPAPPREKTAGVGIGRTLRTAALWLAIWLVPLASVVLAFGPAHWLSRVGAVFAALAAVTFGGAYAMLAWLQQQAVDVQGWLTTAQMIDGLGLAETTPGPLVLVNGFVGFMAGWNNGGWIWGLGGAAMALWQTFAPSFLYIFAGAPYAERLRQSPAATGLLRAVTAAVFGVIASLALWSARHVVFGQVADVATPWGGTVDLPVWASFDVWALGLAVAAGVALIRFHVNVVVVILGCAAVGLVKWIVLG
jgi:chromate transporter